MFEQEKIRAAIINIPDFPSPGIVFKDITPIFLKPELLQEVIDEMKQKCAQLDFDIIVAPESRGYLFAIPLALALQKPFAFVRKKGKLPRATIGISYDLEYGQAEIEVHKDDIKPGSKVLIVDDLLATGGTLQAIEKLIKNVDCEVVGSMFLIELQDLNGREKLTGNIQSLLKY